MGSISKETMLTNIITQYIPIKYNPTELTPEVESEEIIYTVSQNLKIPLVDSYNKMWRDSTRAKTPASHFQIWKYI